MNSILELFAGGMCAAVVTAVLSRAPQAEATTSPEPVATASSTLLLVYDTRRDAPQLQHASALPVAWQARTAPTGARVGRLRILDVAGRELASVATALPAGDGVVGMCRGAGCEAGGHAAAAPLEAVGATHVHTLCAPNLAGAAALVLEERHADHWHTLVHTAPADLAAAMTQGRALHAHVTYGASPVREVVR